MRKKKKRRKLNNKLGFLINNLNMSDNVQVVIKVRPLIQREKDQKFPIEWTIKDNTIIQENGPNKYQFGKKINFPKQKKKKCCMFLN